MELRHLQAFQAVAAELNFSRAARHLHLTQPALSRTIRDLEEMLDCRLFERGGNGVSLTLAGRTFLDESKAVLSRTEELKRRMAAFRKTAITD